MHNINLVIFVEYNKNFAQDIMFICGAYKAYYIGTSYKINLYPLS